MLKPKDILEFWFGALDERGLPSEDKERSWFRSDRKFDQLLRRRFLSYVTLASENGLPEWEETAEGRLALILLLDQFTRNIFRGTALAFEHDRQARQLTKQGLKLGHDTRLPAIARAFFYMPLEHSEKLEDQTQCVELLEQLHAATEGELRQKIAGFLTFAQEHKTIIERFGRFPHRNSVLGRRNSEAEELYLNGNIPRYGQ